MSATATIEEIHGEQIATRTDLLLMRARTARDSRPTRFIRVQRVGPSTTSAAILASVFAIASAVTSMR